MLNLYLWVLRWGHRRWRVLIYGAGTTGIQLAAALKSHDSVVVVAFMDDNVSLQSMTVAGLRVLSPERIETIVKEREIDRVLLAMPSTSAPKLAQIARRLQTLGLDVLALPSFAQLVGAEALVDNLATPELESLVAAKKVLISGYALHVAVEEHAQAVKRLGKVTLREAVAPSGAS